MRCPNNELCDIQFETESWDQGDGVWFQSGWSFVYDASSSSHEPDCPPLTEEQIIQLEKERNEEPPDYDYGLD